MPRRDVLSTAKNNKKDEFYTLYEDIQKELNNYEKHFKGKTVLCNCDDPFESNFCKFFLKNFNYLGLKRLICTSYSTSPFVGKQMTVFDLLGEPVQRGNGYVMDISEVPMSNGRGVSDDDIEKLLKSKKRGVKKLKGDGDFRSDECIEYLKQADIVVTNPPFSLFREYVALLMEHEKQFLIIGNINAITYKEIFPLIKANKVWLGTGMGRWISGFIVPSDYELYGTEARVSQNGERIVSTNNCLWLTNLDHNKRHEEIPLYKMYNPEEYRKYDNYDAINVDKTTEIPCDYDGIMGVPITFLDKYNPEQFEIIELGNSRDNFTPNKDYINPKKHLKDGRVANGGAINCVLAIEYNECPANTIYYTSDNSKYLVPPYARILIKRKGGKK